MPESTPVSVRSRAESRPQPRALRYTKVAVFGLAFLALLLAGQAGRRHADFLAILNEVVRQRDAFLHARENQAAAQPAGRTALSNLRLLLPRAESAAASRKLSASEDLDLRLSRAVLANADQRFTEGLAALHPEDLSFAFGPRAKAMLLLVRADSLFGLERWAEALDQYRQTLALRPRRFFPLSRLAQCQQALGQGAEAVASFRALALAGLQRGDPLFLRRQLGAAVQQYHRALEFLRPAGSNPPLGLAADWAELCNHRGIALLLDRKAEAAAASFSEAVRLVTSPAQNDPSAAPLAHSAALSQRHLGQAFLLQGQPKLAAEQFTNALESLARAPSDSDPGQVSPRALNPALIHRDLGDAALSQGQPGAAAAEYGQAGQILSALLAPDASSAALRDELASIRHSLANARLSQGKIEGVTALCDESIAWLNSRESSSTTPLPAPSPDAARQLALIYNTRGVAARAEQKTDPAAADFSRAIQALDSLPNFSDQDSLTAPPLSADLFDDPGVRVEAVLGFAENAIDVLTRTRLSDLSSSAESSVALAIVCRNRAYTALARRQTADALADFKRSLAIFSRLVDQQGQKDLAAQLARVLTPLAGIYTASSAFRDPVQARALAHRACELTAWNAAPPLEALAAATALAGQFPDAIRFQERALALAPAAQKPSLAARLEAYKSGQPSLDSLP